MPSKNSVKKYVGDGIYHVYNRGVEKRDIFLDKKDYAFFLFLLKTYLQEPIDGLKGFNPFSIPYRDSAIKRGAYSNRVNLLAYALMPNHYHLLIKISDASALTEFMKTIMTIYVMYFNKKYDRVGSLFQGIYKAALIESDEHLLHVCRYIHLNPLGSDSVNVRKTDDFRKIIGSYTSYDFYLGYRKSDWLKTELILSYFSGRTKVREFTEEPECGDRDFLGNCALD